MTTSEITMLVERYIGTYQGYLGKFSYSSHERFYSVYCDLDIDVQGYREEHGTTKKAFIQILKDAQPRDQAKIIRGVFLYDPPPEEPESEDDKRKIAAFGHLNTVAERLEANGVVDVPINLISTETVYQALKDAEVLLAQRGPQFAVDRAHTALHGYLKASCRKRGISVQETASVTDIFGTLRREEAAFKNVVAHDAEARRALGSLATAIDSLNMIRNRASLAHPNEMLLEAPEAMLYINISRALLVYMDSKLAV